MTFIKGQTRFIVLTAILTIFNALITLITPLLLRNIYTNHYQLNYQTLRLVVGCMIGSFLFQFILLIFRENFAINFNLETSKTLYRKMFEMTYDKLLTLEPTYLVNRLLEAVIVFYQFVTSSFVTILGNGLVVLISVIIFSTIDLVLGALMILILPINYIGYKAINQKLQQKSAIMADNNARSLKEILAVFKNTDYLKQESDFTAIETIITPSLLNIYEKMADINKFARGTSLSIELLNSFFQNLLFLWLALAASQNANNLPNLIIASVLFPIYFNAVKSFSSVNLEFRNLKVANEFINNEIIGNSEQSGQHSLQSVQEIKMENVHIEVAQQSLNLSVNQTFVPGDVVYVNGPSGAGKSTLMKALIKFRKSKGISFNGIPLENISNSSLRKRVSYLSQDNTLLPATVQDNILFGRLSVDVNWQKFSHSRLLSPLLTTKDLDSLLYEGGANLSGGEKQRIVIARALVEPADVLILDEVTSNIDKQAADDILATILEATDTITFIISHDKSHRQFCTKEIIL